MKKVTLSYIQVKIDGKPVGSYSKDVAGNNWVAWFNYEGTSYTKSARFLNDLRANIDMAINFK